MTTKLWIVVLLATPLICATTLIADPPSEKVAPTRGQITEFGPGTISSNSAARITGDPIGLGNFSLDGGTEAVTVDQSSIDPSNVPAMTGTATNSYPGGKKITDLTVRVLRKGSSGTGPQPHGGSDDITIGQGTNSQSANSSSISSGGSSPTHLGFGATLDFTPDGGISPICGNESVDVDINVGTLGDATDVEVKITPSVEDKPKGTGLHGDMMEVFFFKSESSSATHAMEDMGNDRIAVDVKNEDDGDDIVQISGLVSFPSSGNGVSAVYLQDPSQDYDEPTGTSVTISSSTEFSITGFTALRPGGTYEVIVVFSDTPDTTAGSLEVKLTASFE